MTGVDTDLATLRDWIGDPEDYSDEDRGAAERACDACDGVEAELSRLRRHPDAWSQEAFDQQKARAEAAEAEKEEWVARTAAASERWEAAEARCARLQQALRDLLENGGWGHSHWDSTGQHGAGCSTCIQQREAKERARAALAGPDTTADSQPEASGEAGTVTRSAGSEEPTT